MKDMPVRLRGLTRTRQRMCRHDRPPRQHNEEAFCGDGVQVKYCGVGCRVYLAGITGAPRTKGAPRRKGWPIPVAICHELRGHMSDGFERVFADVFVTREEHHIHTAM